MPDAPGLKGKQSRVPMARRPARLPLSPYGGMPVPPVLLRHLLFWCQLMYKRHFLLLEFWNIPAVILKHAEFCTSGPAHIDFNHRINLLLIQSSRQMALILGLQLVLLNPRY